MILTAAELKSLEARAIADGVSAESLMEEAGAQIAAAVWQFTGRAGVCVVFFGKGNNGGDALVAARELAAGGWKIHLQPAFDASQWSALTRKKYAEAEVWSDGAKLPPQSRDLPLVLLDGLLGIGAHGPLREPIAGMAREINWLRATSHARVFSLDLPTGLDADTGEVDANCVRADFTLTIGFAKQGMLADRATACTGRLAVLPLDALSARHTPANDEACVATACELAPLLAPRPFDIHKGDCGRVGIVAGSPGFTGAASLCAEGALRAGAGLVTLYATPDIADTLAARTAPEIMVRRVGSYHEVPDDRHDVLAIGPGLGLAHTDAVLRLIKRALCPAILDADALNMLAAHPETLGSCAGERLLTPHPGEMARLDPASAHRPRRETVRDFTQRHPVTLLLKGARTLVGQHGCLFSYNTTGSPGMATGGMGDVLTGVCAALAGQRLSLYAAARVGAWLCGRAAELAIHRGTESEESLSATALLAHLGGAFRELRARSL